MTPELPITYKTPFKGMAGNSLVKVVKSITKIGASLGLQLENRFRSILKSEGAIGFLACPAIESRLKH